MNRITQPVGVALADPGKNQRMGWLFKADQPFPAETTISFEMPFGLLPTNTSGVPIAVLYQGHVGIAWKNRRLCGFVVPSRPLATPVTFSIDAYGRLTGRTGGTPLERFPHSNDMPLLTAEPLQVLATNPEPAQMSAPTQSKAAVERAVADAAIFVSHAASDAQSALKLVEAIERTGRRCWIAPRDVRAGRDFREEIVMAISHCDSMVVLISKSANESQHILRELGLAEQYGKPVKPVRLDDSKLAPAFEYQLHGKHWVRFEPSLKFVDALVPD